jgi:hypothetical protein
VASPSFDYINQIWAYNVTSDTWRNASASGAPTERSEASMVVVGSTLLIYGGDGPSYSGDTLTGGCGKALISTIIQYNKLYTIYII